MESVLGRGGMGVVYKARHVKLRRAVAVKMLLFGRHATGVEIARFLQEARTIASLRHPHVVQVHDVGECGGLPYFTMEWLEGGSLAERLGGAAQPPARAAALSSLSPTRSTAPTAAASSTATSSRPTCC